MKMKFAYSFDKESYGCTYDSVEGALKDAIAEIEDIREYNASDIPEKIFVGECQFYDPTLSAYDAIEAVQKDASDVGGEWADDYLDDVTQEQVEELKKGLEDVFQNWIKKHNLYPNFYTVSAVSVYTYDEAIAYIKEKQNEKSV